MRRTIKPNDSSFVVWLTHSIFFAGMWTGIFIWGNEWTVDIGVVYTIVYGVISLGYFVGRIVTKKLLGFALDKAKEMGVPLPTGTEKES